jgi:redox-sensitive bicupin YhaK (pirin superfamily)
MVDHSKFVKKSKTKMTIKKIPKSSFYRTDQDWRTSRYHFSFADYEDPKRTHFGVLRALNDEVIQSQNGFDLHPHAEMEILSYCVEGELNHKDNMGNDVTIRRGDIQYMCAGSGVMHEECNPSPDQPLRFIQIWIDPDEDGLIPHYEYKNIVKRDRLNKWLWVASGNGFRSAFKINQDANVYICELSPGHQIEFETGKNRQSYVVCLEGTVNTDRINLGRHDALEITSDHTAVFQTSETAHLLLVEMGIE